MKCRDVGPHIADWVAGRLEPGLAPRVQEHLACCEACRREAAAESRMRDLLGSFATEDLHRDLAPAVTARIAAAHAPRRFGLFRPAPAFAFALAGVACAVVLWTKVQSPVGPAVAVKPVDESRVVRMVADMQQIPDSTDESLLAGSSTQAPWLASENGGGD